MVGNLPTWPITLPPRFLASGYGEQNQDNLLRFSPEKGQDLTRRLYTRPVLQVQGNLRLTNTQKSILEQFYGLTLESGSISFNWVRPDTGTPAVCKFTQPIGFAPVSAGLYWQAAISLTVT